MKIAIIGGTGWVGKAVNSLFPDAYVYTDHVGTKEEVNKCDVVFICVPTPNVVDSKAIPGSLDTSIVEDVIKWCRCPLKVIRSTINPGTCRKFWIEYGQKVVYQPEYLGETPQHPLLDQKKLPFLVIGGEQRQRRELIDLYTTVYNANVNIRQVTWEEAEVIKLSENRAIALKVAECQELYDVCEKADIDYYTVRDAVYGDDPRFNLWWTFVFPEKRGFNSKCIPKDVYAWAAWAESCGYNPEITWAVLERNEKWINSAN